MWKGDVFFLHNKRFYLHRNIVNFKLRMYFAILSFVIIVGVRTKRGIFGFLVAGKVIYDIGAPLVTDAIDEMNHKIRMYFMHLRTLNKLYNF